MDEQKVKNKILSIMKKKQYFSTKDNVVFARKLFIINQVLRLYAPKLLTNEDDKVIQEALNLIDKFVAGEINFIWSPQKKTYQIFTKKAIQQKEVSNESK